jgi:RNA polymerase sigma-32 factor
MSTALSLAQLNMPILANSLDAYVQRVNQIPLLSAEEEQELAERWYNDADTKAAKQLVISNLRFVVHIARGYSGYGLALEDLIQEGNLGLMKAVKRFDPAVGVRLISFAVHWIKSEIHDFVIRNWRIVRIATTKAQRKLFFNLRGAKKRLGWFSDDEVNQVASELKVSPHEIREMEMRLQGQDVTFEAHDDEDDDHESYHPAPTNYLTNVQDDPAYQLETLQAQHIQRNALHDAWQKLNQREQDIVRRRWLQQDKATLQDLATEYQVSAERVRQIEQQALRKLQENAQNH